MAARRRRLRQAEIHQNHLPGVVKQHVFELQVQMHKSVAMDGRHSPRQLCKSAVGRRWVRKPWPPGPSPSFNLLEERPHALLAEAAWRDGVEEIAAAVVFDDQQMLGAAGRFEPAFDPRHAFHVSQLPLQHHHRHHTRNVTSPRAPPPQKRNQRLSEHG
jgi:hypothetical protein